MNEDAGTEAYRESEYTRTAELFLTQAELAGAADRFHQALEAARKEMTEDPGNAVGYYQAARAQIGLQDYAAADTLLHKALELYPAYQADADHYRELAWIAAFNSSISFQNVDSTEAVLEQLEGAELIFPGKRPEALINLGVTYELLGRLDEAIDAFGAALDVIRGPQTEERMTRDSAIARGWLEKEANVASNRAMLLSRQNRYEEAADEYGVYLARHPGDITALSNMAAALSAADMADSAQAIYDNLLVGEEMGIRDYFNIGVGLYMADNFAKAAEAFQKVVEMSPQNRDALLNLTTALYQAADYEACAPVAQRLVEIDVYGEDNYAMLARCMNETEDEQAAAAAIENLEKLRFNIANAFLTPNVGGGGSVTGDLTNKSLEPGTNITIIVHFNGGDGSTVGSKSIRVEAPAQGETASFRADLASGEDIMGYYFQVVPPR